MRHIAVLGKGALGRVYGAALAHAERRVSFVVPERQLSRGGRLVVRQRQTGRELEIAEPTLVTRIPADADAALVCLRLEDLESTHELLAGRTGLPVFVLTPAFPEMLEALEARTGVACSAGIPGIAADHLPNGVTEYWPLPLARTLFDVNHLGRERVGELCALLGQSDLVATPSTHVAERNAATTAAFYPITVGVAVAGSFARLAADRELTELTTRACRETVELGRQLGRIDPGVRLLVALLGGARLGWAARLFPSVAPQSATFFEDHFGHKLNAQHQTLGAAIVGAAERRGLALPAVRQLIARHAARSAGPLAEAR